MTLWGSSWEYILFYISLSIFSGYVLDIILTTQTQKMPVLFKIGKIKIFGTVILPIVILITLYTKSFINNDFLQMASGLIYFGASAIFIYSGLRAREQKRRNDFNLLLLLALIFFVLGILSK